ncbi:hypothetical protein M3Y98_00966000 [Aphelenchoides besseyi]|nr:hypothetical protein M3Y98_00966000 [Aphelenchoides besseyi]KAI6194736.1 hypothetical protein M3Y96_01156200 [Aphelenchoides besseyi]
MLFVQRLSRMNRLLHGLFKEFPEQFIFISTIGVGGTVVLGYKLWKWPSNTKPWYRSRFDVVRSDSEVAMARRPPEDYPAPYLANRRNTVGGYKTYLKDYGWKANLD